MSNHPILKSLFFLAIISALLVGGANYLNFNLPFLQEDREFYVDAARENVSAEDLNVTRFESGENNYVHFQNGTSRIEVRVDDDGNIVSKAIRSSPGDSSQGFVLSQEEALNRANEYLQDSSWRLVESSKVNGNYVFEMAKQYTHARIWVDGSEGDIVYYYRDYQSNEQEDEPYEDSDGRTSD
ncbi:MAG: hypothetical protein ACI83Q_000641 [Colwellia polaris]|jgi:hypothetical protein